MVAPQVVLAVPIGRIAATSFATVLFLYGFLYYGNYRYRLPYKPLMAVVAAAFVTRVVRLRDRVSRYHRTLCELCPGDGCALRHSQYGSSHASRRADGQRPTWRGLFHTWAFLAAIPAGVLLIVFADRPAARTAASIYATTLLLVFGTSAAYHRLAHRTAPGRSCSGSTTR